MTPKPNPSDPGPLAKRKLNTRTTSSANMSQTEPPSQASPMKDRMELAAKTKDEDKLYKRDGILYSTILSPPETMDKLKDLEVRDDDVVLVAYPKCGFNWVVAVLRKIMNASTGKNEAPPERPPLVEFLPPDVQQTLSEMPPRRLLGTHLHPDNMPASFFSKKPKILVVFRNPKDTLVSYFHFMNKNPVLPSAEPWDKFYSDFMSGEVAWGSYFDHALAWEKRFDDPKVMIVMYEELKQHLPEEVKKISEFFGFPLTEEQVNSIAEQSTFRAMLETSNKSHGNLGSVFFRKGEVGDWKNLFSEAQSKQMDEVFHSKMAGTKLGAQMKYDLYCK